MPTQKKPTKAEAEWLRALEAVLNECPSNRLECFTTGDKGVFFYDKIALNAWIKEDPAREEMDIPTAVEASRAGLGSVSAPFFIVATRG